MNLYIAGNGVTDDKMEEYKKKTYLRKDKLYLLNSYLEIKNKKNLDKRYFNYRYDKDQFFLDSGAFTAFTQGKVIHIDDYIDFIKKNENEITLYASLDVIGDYEKSRVNQEYMESKGLNPLPTFHAGSPLEELERMVEKYDYIALGGLVPLALDRKRMKAWLDKCWKVIFNNTIKKNKPLTKIHGFGVNALWAWERYPFYSVDATSWVTGSKFRRTVRFNNGKMTTSKKDKSRNLDTINLYTKEYYHLNLQNIDEYYKSSNYVTNLWKKRGIIWE